jgi:hypothetical protein
LTKKQSGIMMNYIKQRKEEIYIAHAGYVGHFGGKQAQ